MSDLVSGHASHLLLMLMLVPLLLLILVHVVDVTESGTDADSWVAGKDLFARAHGG